ncbi:putative F-box protein At3g16210 [Abrus precatorius]|uniref:F-box protein At3g16210 n=1 Tax=Abrus precatorius TaxID=3816 RepID=A0A8B8K5H0_ABRPR|nr:putative F-box protein At3g16210 [Abrus precatorius]
MVGNGNGNGNGNSKDGFLPDDVLINILKRVLVKSLIRFKCVSKDWLNLLQTPYFTEQHLHHSSHNSTFLLLQRIPHSFHRPSLTASECLIGPDFTVHHPQFIDFTSPDAMIVGSCNGLLCVRHSNYKLSLFNPATRQIRHIPETLIHVKSCYYVGFGFSPVVNDYKIVRISLSELNDEDGIVVLDNVRVNRAEVYSLRTGSWKEIDALVLQSLGLWSNSVTNNGAIFWQATMTESDHEFVISFDIAEEVFTLLEGPPTSPAICYSHVLAVHNDKLAMFRYAVIGNYESCSIDLWVLENNGTCAVAGESWIKMYSVRPLSGILYPLSIWRDLIVCWEESGGYGDEHGGVKIALSFFNPYSNELKKLPSHREEYSYASFNYAQSLVSVGNVHHEQ